MLSASADSVAVLTDSDARGFFADQFENKSNYDAHFDGTGPQVWRQTNGNVKAFVSGAGASQFTSILWPCAHCISLGRHGWDDRGRGPISQVDGRGHCHLPRRSARKRTLQQGTVSSPIANAYTHIHQVKHGVMFDLREKEGTKRRHQVDTVVEGMCVPSPPSIPSSTYLPNT